MKLTTALLIAIPIEALNFHLLDICSLVDGCDSSANFVEITVGHLSMIMHSPALFLLLRSTLSYTPIGKSLGTLTLVLNGYAVTVLLILAFSKLLKFARRSKGAMSQS